MPIVNSILYLYSQHLETGFELPELQFFLILLYCELILELHLIII